MTTIWIDPAELEHRAQEIAGQSQAIVGNVSGIHAWNLPGGSAFAAELGAELEAAEKVVLQAVVDLLSCAVQIKVRAGEIRAAESLVHAMIRLLNPPAPATVAGNGAVSVTASTFGSGGGATFGPGGGATAAYDPAAAVMNPVLIKSYYQSMKGLDNSVSAGIIGGGVRVDDITKNLVTSSGRSLVGSKYNASTGKYE